MKTKILTIIAIFIISSCCKNTVKESSKIYEKVTTQTKGGGYIYYNFILENGEQIQVNGSIYVSKKVGDLYWTYKCND